MFRIMSIIEYNNTSIIKPSCFPCDTLSLSNSTVKNKWTGRSTEKQSLREIFDFTFYFFHWHPMPFYMYISGVVFYLSDP